MDRSWTDRDDEGARDIWQLIQLDRQDSPTITPRLVVGGMRVRE